MKSICLVAALAVFIAAGAQHNNGGSKLYKTKVPGVMKVPLYNRQVPVKTTIENVPGAYPDAKLLAELPNKNRVFALPQDGMPCIVPDPSQNSLMVRTPSTKPYDFKGPGAMPNLLPPKPALPAPSEQSKDVK